jgi:L-ascorbate metabolism protein UlaG (beta-lactamase superfamily)
MTCRFAFSVLIALGVSLSSAAGAVSVCVLGNEAVQVRSEGKRVLIDGLYREGYPEDVVLAEDLRQRIETADGDFDELDLVLVTHSHKDHFSAAAVLRHFANNPLAELISTSEVIETVASEIPVARRRSAPPSLEPVTIRAGGIDVLVFNLNHGANNQIQNLGFLLELDGNNIFHLGDAMAKQAALEAAGVADHPVDVALVPFWYYIDEENAGQLDGILKAEIVIPIHMPRPDADKQYLARFGGFEGLQAAISKIRPNIVQFEGGAGCLAEIK